MEHHGQYGHDTARVDEQVAGHGTATTGVPGATTGGHQMQPMKEDHKTDGLLRRSGSSSSSSSSEDDGMGGRRKKGMKEKIKEKLPGGNKDNQATATTGTTAASTGEKKGVMEKIKEKLPGKN